MHRSKICEVTDATSDQVSSGAMKAQGGLQDFHHLMRYRIMDILLVASAYASFVLEEAGQIGERVVGEFRNLDLHYGPGMTTVPSGSDALAMLTDVSRFNVVVSGLHLP